MRKRRLFLSLAPVLALLLACTLRPVRDDEMAPGLVRGDWMLVLPIKPGPGDVVRLPDPLDPGRLIQRRLLANAGQTVGFQSHTAVVDGAGLRQLEMARDKQGAILKEERWLVSIGPYAAYHQVPETRVPPDMVWLAADHRDEATDSRFWGPIPRSTLGSVVILRFGRPNPWMHFVDRP